MCWRHNINVATSANNNKDPAFFFTPWSKIPLCSSHKFKALELNKKIMEGAEALKKPPVKEPTVPEGFELQVEKRLQKRQASKAQEEEKPHQFKSHPLPKKILEGVVVSFSSDMHRSYKEG